MKIKLLVALLIFGHVISVNAQIKIGDNPQNIDASSVLELESSDRVLVITRVNTAQMDAIVPSEGGMVYNIDENCIFYYNGTEWLNLCASLGLSLTADALVNDFPTIILTENGPQTNIEVGEIRGSNIVDFSISAADIQNNSITSDKLAPASVGVEELQDNTVADAEIDYNQVTLADFINDAGYISAADIVSANAGNDIIDNGGAFYDDSPLQNDIAANAAAIAADGDTDATNEIQTLSITGNQLGIAGGNTVDLSAFNNAGTDDQTLNLSGNTLTIEDGNSVDLSALNNSGSDDQTLSLSGNTLSIEDGNNVNLSVFNNPGTDDQNLTSAILSGNVLTLNIENGNPATVDLSPLSGTGTDDQNLSLSGNVISIEDGNNIDLTPILGGGGTDDQQLSLSGNTLALEDGGNVNLSGFLDNTDNQNLTGASLSPGNILSIDIENGSSTTVDLSPLVGTGTDDQVAFEVPFTPTGNTASLDVQAAIEELQTEIDGISAGGAANPTDELITSFALNGTGLDIAEGANILPTVDLDVTFATDAELAALPIDDMDADPLNEIQDLSSVLTQGADANATVITNAADPVNPQDVATKAYVDANGGGVVVSADLPNSIITGTDGGALYDDPDADPANEIQDLSSVLTQGADANATVITNAADPVNPQDVATKAYVDTNIGVVVVSADLPNSIITGTDGGALYDDPDADPLNEIQDLSSVLTQGADANASVITNAADPVNPQDVATKAYVDTNGGGHLGTPGSLFFADTDGTPTENNPSLFWNPTARFGTGALAIGLDGGPFSTVSKVQVAEELAGQISYPLHIQNRSGDVNPANDNIGSAVGLLMGVDALVGIGKGAIAYQRNTNWARGDFHILQNTAANASAPDLSDAVVTVTNGGNMGIGTTTPNEQLHVTGNFELDGNLIAKNGAGTIGQVLTTTAAGTEWANPSGGGLVVSSDAPNSITAGTDGGALYNDLDPDPTNEITSVIDNLDGTTTVTDVNGGTVTLDNDGVDDVDDADPDPNNEIELPAGGVSGQVLSTDGAGVYNWVNNGSGSSVLSDGNTIIGDGTIGNELQVADGGIVGGIGGTISDNTITAADLAPNSVDQSELQADSVGESELIDAAVSPQKIQPGSDGQVLTTTLGAVVWANPASGGSVTVDNVTIQGDGAGTPLFVPNGGIDSNQIATAAVTNAKIAPSITNGQVLTTNSGAVTWADPVDSSPLVGIGKINAGGGAARITSGLASSVNWTGTGQCTVNLNVGFVSTSNYIINVSVQGDNRIYITFQDASSFSIEIRDSSDVLTNAVWHFSLFE